LLLKVYLKMPSIKSLISLAAVLAHAMASPAATDATLEVLSTKNLPEGILTVYGSRGSAHANPVFDRSITARQSCGSNDLLCRDSNAASVGTCSTLIDILSATENVFSASVSRAVCLDHAGDRCCTSWSRAVNDLEEYVLVIAAEKIFNGCTYDGDRVGGSARNVLLMSTCVTQCLSNRPDGCY
jgi:hypothetical protein